MTDTKKKLEEQFLNYIFDNMEDAVCVTDRVGILLYANAAARSLLNLAPERGENQVIWESIPFVEKNDDLIQLFIDTMLSGKEIRQSLVSYENTEGSVLQLRVSMNYTKDAGGLFIIIMNDLTEFLKVNSAFVRYTSPDIAAYVLGSPSGSEAGGETRCVTVLMSDLRDFTGIASGMEPGRLVQMVNHYFEKMLEAIEDRKGTVIEFLGDGIFAVFGAPNEDPDHAGHAVECAVEMQNRMRDVNEWNRQMGYPELSMGIGINSGNCVIGNIGSPRKMKYGCMGDTANLAGRTESVTVGGQIYITRNTMNLIEEPVLIRSELTFHPKGEKEQVTVYDVHGIGDRICHIAQDEFVWKKMREGGYEIMVHNVEGKTVMDACFSGRIKCVSQDHHYACLGTDVPMELMQNIMLEDDTKIFAKIIGRDGEDYVVCFTSRPETFDSWILQVLSDDHDESHAGSS